MRHKNNRRAEPLLDPEQVVLRFCTNDRIERTERLVHQQYSRFGGKRTRNPYSLLLATGQLMRKLDAEHRRIELKHRQQFIDSGIDTALFPAEQSRHGCDILAHGTVREETVTLDRVADPTSQQMRRFSLRILAIDQHATAGRLDQPVDHSQQRRLAGTRCSNNDRNRVLLDRHRDVVDNSCGTVGLGQPI